MLRSRKAGVLGVALASTAGASLLAALPSLTAHRAALATCCTSPYHFTCSIIHRRWLPVCCCRSPQSIELQSLILCIGLKTYHYCQMSCRFRPCTASEHFACCLTGHDRLQMNSKEFDTGSMVLCVSSPGCMSLCKAALCWTTQCVRPAWALRHSLPALPEVAPAAPVGV